MDPPLHTWDKNTVEAMDIAFESSPKKAKTGMFAGKVMAIVFWDVQRIILIDYLQNGKTITEAQ